MRLIPRFLRWFVPLLQRSHSLLFSLLTSVSRSLLLSPVLSSPQNDASPAGREDSTEIAHTACSTNVANYLYLRETPRTS
jgi:hypothetical protein